MKVYLVYEDDYDGRLILNVVDSEEKANEIIEEYKSELSKYLREQGYGDRYNYEGWDVE